MPNSQLTADYLEAVSVGTPKSQLTADYLEAVSVGTPKSQETAVYVEVLTPSALITQTAGWGTIMS